MDADCGHSAAFQYPHHDSGEWRCSICEKPSGVLA